MVIKKELLPDSPDYLDIKAACLNAIIIFKEVFDFRNFDNAERIYLYEYNPNNYDEILRIFQTIKDDFNLFKYRACIIYYNFHNLSEMRTQMDEIFKIMDTFSDLGFTFQWVGRKDKIEVKLLCC